MNKREAKAIAEIINASFMVMADHPTSETIGCSVEGAEKILKAQREWGEKILARHGLDEPFVEANGVYLHVMGNKQ